MHQRLATRREASSPRPAGWNNPSHRQPSMDESQTNGAEGAAEEDTAVGGPTPKDEDVGLATDSHILEQSNGSLAKPVPNEALVNGATAPPGDLLHHSSAASETRLVLNTSESSKPPALANGDALSNGQHFASLSDDQGDPTRSAQEDPSQVDDDYDDSTSQSGRETIKAFAKLEFEDSDFYMTTHAVEFGRDIRATRSQPDFSIRRSRKRSSSDRSDQPRKRHKEQRNYTSSVVSEKAGIMGVDCSHDERGETLDSNLEQLRSPTGHYPVENLLDDPPPPSTDQMPPADIIPLIPIHPPANANGFAARQTTISRRHVRIFYNDEIGVFQVLWLGTNGGFVDSQWYACGETVTLVSGSAIQLHGICIRFILPNVPEGEPSERMRGGAAIYDMSDSDEPEGINYPFPVRDCTGVIDYEDREEVLEDNLPRRRKVKRRRDYKPEPKPTPTPELEVEVPRLKRKGPGRPPKNGIMSKREQALQAREARENAKAKSQENTNKTQERGKGKTAKALELEASHLQPNGKRKYTKRKKAVEIEATQRGRESTEQDEPVQTEAATKPAKEKKPVKPPRSPSPQYNEAELTAEQLMKPASSYVVLIHEALSSSKTGQMSLPQIYRAIERRYPYFKVRVTTQGWQSSVRHNLLQHPAFIKIIRDGKGWMWGLVPEVSIEKEKKRRPTPPSAHQQNYQYPPQAPRYPPQSHPYPYPNIPAPVHGAMPFPYAVPPMPYPPRIGMNGIPMPFVPPQAESTYKSPYDSNPGPSQAPPTATLQPSTKTNGVDGHHPTSISQPPQHSALATTTPTVSLATNGAPVQQNAQRGTHRYSEEILTKINTFKVQLMNSLNPKSNPERLVSSVIDHKLYGSPLKADEGSDERSILTALENIILAGEGRKRSTESAAAAAVPAVDTVAEKAADIARKIRDDETN